jgi:hypothetical protein
MAGALPTAHIAPNLNGYTQDQTWVEVTQAPGTRVTKDRLDARSFSFNCYAPTLEETEDLTEAALEAILSMRGVHGSLVVTEVTVGVTPFDLTDQIDNQYRMVFDVNVYVRPL